MNNGQFIENVKKRAFMFVRRSMFGGSPVRHSERLRRCLFLSTASYLTLATPVYSPSIIDLNCSLQGQRKFSVVTVLSRYRLFNAYIYFPTTTMKMRKFAQITIIESWLLHANSEPVCNETG
jgi:hypothetical protein